MFTGDTDKAHKLYSRKPVRPELEYPIFVGDDWFDEIVMMIKGYVGDHMVAVVVDEKVGELYQERLDALYRELPRMRIMSIMGGETAKTPERYLALHEFLIANDIHKDDLIISIGGGTILDLTGFAAGTYMRGIRWISIPTTFISQVDCGIGGKTSINIGTNKNYIGTFYWTDGLFVDLSFLKTLPDVYFKSAIPEIAKMGLIGDAQLFTKMCELTSKDGLDGIRNAVLDIALSTIKVKAATIEQDPYQAGTRAALLMGHTTAHALESASKLHLPHGEAVAIGLAFESYIARKYDLISVEDRRALNNMLENCGLKISLPSELHDRMIIDCMRREKQNRGRNVGMIVPVEPGKMLETWPKAKLQLSLDEIWGELVKYRKELG